MPRRFSNKMGWKNLSYAMKGGIIGFIIPILTLLLIAITFYLSIKNRYISIILVPLLILGFFILAPPLMWAFLFEETFPAIFNLFFKRDFFTLPTKWGIIFDVIIYTLIGYFIGWRISKNKSHKPNTE